MSTSPETTRPDDAIVSLLSEWLAFRSSTDELRRRLEAIGTTGLADEPTAAMAELMEQLASTHPGNRGELERLVRETLDAVALG
ncbi:MAG TPA: hypothetical protein VFR32_03805 [Gaiellaceae bacterium]|nr:hypothetical protein [Gaiellaceae bacterium]